MPLWDLPHPGIEPVSAVIGRQILYHWTTAEAHVFAYLCAGSEQRKPQIHGAHGQFQTTNLKPLSNELGIDGSGQLGIRRSRDLQCGGSRSVRNRTEQDQHSSPHKWRTVLGLCMEQLQESASLLLLLFQQLNFSSPTKPSLPFQGPALRKDPGQSIPWHFQKWSLLLWIPELFFNTFY